MPETGANEWVQDRYALLVFAYQLNVKTYVLYLWTFSTSIDVVCLNIPNFTLTVSYIEMFGCCCTKHNNNVYYLIELKTPRLQCSSQSARHKVHHARVYLRLSISYLLIASAIKEIVFFIEPHMRLLANRAILYTKRWHARTLTHIKTPYAHTHAHSAMSWWCAPHFEWTCAVCLRERAFTPIYRNWLEHRAIRIERYINIWVRYLLKSATCAWFLICYRAVSYR